MSLILLTFPSKLQDDCSSSKHHIFTLQNQSKAERERQTSCSLSISPSAFCFFSPFLLPYFFHSLFLSSPLPLSSLILSTSLSVFSSLTFFPSSSLQLGDASFQEIILQIFIYISHWLELGYIFIPSNKEGRKSKYLAFLVSLTGGRFCCKRGQYCKVNVWLVAKSVHISVLKAQGSFNFISSDLFLLLRNRNRTRIYSFIQKPFIGSLLFTRQCGRGLWGFND